MSGEIAGWQARLPERSRYGVVQALRQTLEAAVRWGYMRPQPGQARRQNPQPPPRPVRAFTRAELDAIAAELRPAYRPLPGVRRGHRAAARGVAGARAPRRRPRRRRARPCGAPSRAARWSSSARRRRSRRQVPLSPRAPRRSTSSRRGSTRRSCSRARGRAAGPGQLPAPRVGARDRGVRGRAARPGSTTCGPRSPPKRSPRGVACSSWRG